MRTGAAVQAQGSAAVQWLSQGSAQGGSGTGKSSCRQRYRDGGSAGLVWLRAAEAGAAVAQGLGAAEKQEAGRENMK